MSRSRAYHEDSPRRGKMNHEAATCREGVYNPWCEDTSRRLRKRIKAWVKQRKPRPTPYH